MGINNIQAVEIGKFLDKFRFIKRKLIIPIFRKQLPSNFLPHLGIKLRRYIHLSKFFYLPTLFFMQFAFVLIIS